MQFFFALLHHAVAAANLSLPIVVLTHVADVPDPSLSRY